MFQVFLDMLCCGLLFSLDGVSTSQISVSMMDALTAVSMDIFTFMSSFCLSTCRRSILSLPPMHRTSRHTEFCFLLIILHPRRPVWTWLIVLAFFTPEKRAEELLGLLVGRKDGAENPAHQIVHKHGPKFLWYLWINFCVHCICICFSICFCFVLSSQKYPHITDCLGLLLWD